MPMYWWSAVYSSLLLENGDFLLLEDGSKIVTEASTTTQSWRLTNDLYVYDGSWKNVLNCWIYDGANWKVCYVDEAMTLNTFLVFDFGGGTLQFDWTYTGTRPQDWRIYIDKSSDLGLSWTNLTNYDVTVSPQLLTSLSSSDWYRCRLAFATDTAYQATGSPIVQQPPYPV
jgi:hypothetical protein